MEAEQIVRAHREAERRKTDAEGVRQAHLDQIKFQTKEIKAALTELYFLKFSGGVFKLDGSLLTAKQKQAMQELASNAARDIAQA
eukprot:g59317.t1